MLDVVKIAPIYHNELFDKIQYTVEIITDHFQNHTAVSVRRMCAKLMYDLLNNIVKPIERNQTAAKLKVNLKKLLTKCAKHKLIHKNPRGHKMPITKPPPVLQGYIVPGSISKKSTKKSMSTRRRSERNKICDTESDEEQV